MKCPVIILTLLVLGATLGAALDESDLLKARDHQDRAALEKMAAEWHALADKQPNDAAAQYRFALAESYSAEVAIEVHDKAGAKNAAQAGMDAATKAVNMKPDSGEYQRILGTLCGQMISSSSLAGLKYGKCALDAVDKAIELDPKSSMAYLSHGVGNFYLPQALGGGLDLAVKDFQKAIELDPQSADAHLWLGLALRKLNRDPEARKEFQRAIELNPARAWAKQQLEKTPAQ